jgi:hypothetical protein
MKVVVTNLLTGKVEEIEQEEIIESITAVMVEPTLEERLQATENALLTLLSMGVV